MSSTYRGYEPSRTEGVRYNIIGGGSNMSGAALGAQLGMDFATNVINYNIARSNRAQQKRLQLMQWAREDTAHQREVADLRAAGLSPTLTAGGSGAPTTIQTLTPPPKWEGSDVKGAILADKQLGVMNENIRLIRANISNSTMQTLSNIAQQNAQTQNIQSMMPFLQQESRARTASLIAGSGLSYANMRRIMHDLSIAQENNLPTNPSTLGGTVRDLIPMMSAPFGEALRIINGMPAQQNGATGEW